MGVHHVTPSSTIQRERVESWEGLAVALTNASETPVWVACISDTYSYIPSRWYMMGVAPLTAMAQTCTQ